MSLITEQQAAKKAYEELQEKYGCRENEPTPWAEAQGFRLLASLA